MLSVSFLTFVLSEVERTLSIPREFIPRNVPETSILSLVFHEANG